MQPPPQGTALFSGIKPQNKGLAYELAAGVFSETQDYTGRIHLRPSFSSAALLNRFAQRGRGNWRYFATDKDAARLPVRYWGGAAAEK